MKNRIGEEHGKALVQIARKTIENSLGVSGNSDDPDSCILKDDVLREKHGVFVTLTKLGQLRGCIGFLEGRESVADAVMHNAVNAAFNDPRFSPLHAAELKDIAIEVSVLTDPAGLEYHGADDLLEKLRPGIDGVIIRSGMAAATFLPQVWEQLPEKEEFLSHLCLKAGLPAGTWKKGTLEVLTYQVQHFNEHK